MGESSTPRRPTHDTNTSRRQVNTNTHTTTTTTTTTTALHQSKYTMKITGLIASTFMLLVAVMASTASAFRMGGEEPCYSGDLMIKHGNIGDNNKCCWNGRFTPEAKCLNKPSDPNNCFALKLNKEIMHGELSPNFCCWYGQWLPKDKCANNKTSHPDNCYAVKLNKEVKHGELGPRAKKCCLYGQWEPKSRCN